MGPTFLKGCVRETVRRLRGRDKHGLAFRAVSLFVSGRITGVTAVYLEQGRKWTFARALD
ncbi:MAG: hypothetical protein ACR2K2_13195 [Mycobacteriales bacterium]